VKAVKQKISGDIAKYHMGIIRWSKMHTKDYNVHYTSKIGFCFLVMLFSRCLTKPVDSTHDCDISVCGFNKKEIIGIPEQPFFVSKEITTCLSS